MKNLILLLLTALLITSCSKQSEISELQAKNETLIKKFKNLQQESNQKNLFIEEYTTTINSVYDRLESIRQREKILDNFSRNKENVTMTIRERMEQNLNSINRMLQSSKKELSQLKEKLYTSRMQSVTLEDMISSLNGTLTQKENYIAELKTELGLLSNRIEAAKQEISEKADQLARQEKELNTGYIAIGSAKDLKQLGIIEERGGILGLRKTKKLATNFNDDHFTSTDILKTPSISIDEKIKDVKIISPHQQDSYVLRQTEENQTILEIINPTEFWKIKYLVILTRA